MTVTRPMAEGLRWLDATSQADVVARREATPTELVDAAIQRIEWTNPTLNAVVIPLFDEARASAAGHNAGPFAGVPFLLKDIGAVLKGMPVYMGNRLLKEMRWQATEDSPLARRFRDAGLITLGKTNTPEFALGAATQPASFGATLNPWHPDLSTSGSSGGSAAAVAAGLVPMAHGGDSGGSIRMPAAWCGVVGYKPSRGLIPTAPGHVERYSVEFALARTIRDVASLLDCVTGTDPGQLFTSPQVHSYAEALKRTPGQLRVGVLTTTGAAGVVVDLACARAATRTASTMASLGHYVSEAESPLDEDPYLPLLQAVRVMRRRDETGRLIGRVLTSDDLEPMTNQVAGEAEAASVGDYLAAESGHQRYAARIAAWFQERYDVLVTPTLPEVPMPIAAFTRLGQDPAALRQRFLQLNVFTRPFNLTGQPAVSLPLAHVNGVPIGVQIVAAHGRDDLLVSVAAALEEASPWASRVPPITTMS